MKRRSLIHSALACAVPLTLGAVTLPVWAQDKWPSKPINYVVPCPAGGTTDILGRLIGQKLGPALGTTIVIENRGGAGGSAAAVQRPAGACAGIFGHCSGGAAGGRKLYCAAHSGQRHGHFRPVGAGGYCGGRRTVRHSGHGHRGAGTGGGGQPCQSGPAQGTGWGKNKTGRGNIARNQCNIFHHTVCIMLRFCPLKSRR